MFEVRRDALKSNCRSGRVLDVKNHVPPSGVIGDICVIRGILL